MDNPTVHPKLVVNPFKSVVASFLLACFFGPIGVIYNSILISILLLFLFLIVMTIKPAGIVLGLIVWIISIYLSVFLANRRNKKIFRKLDIIFK